LFRPTYHDGKIKGESPDPNSRHWNQARREYFKP